MTQEEQDRYDKIVGELAILKKEKAELDEKLLETEQTLSSLISANMKVTVNWNGAKQESIYQLFVADDLQVCLKQSGGTNKLLADFLTQELFKGITELLTYKERRIPRNAFSRVKGF